MNRWKGPRSWALVWIFFLLVGGMILYAGYLGTLYFSSQEKTTMITNEADQAVSASTTHDPEAGGTGLIMQTQTEEMTSNDPLNIKDFPSPVQGNHLRSVGNYYSEAFDNYLFHAGMDYAEPEGTVIRATHGGKVIFSGADPILGQKVTLDCGEGWLVTYGGLVNRRVQVGETVETQDALGQVGFFTVAESESDQPQLHYEVWHGDEIQGPR